MDFMSLEDKIKFLEGVIKDLFEEKINKDLERENERLHEYNRALVNKINVLLSDKMLIN